MQNYDAETNHNNQNKRHGGDRLGEVATKRVKRDYHASVIEACKKFIEENTFIEEQEVKLNTVKKRMPMLVLSPPSAEYPDDKSKEQFGVLLRHKVFNYITQTIGTSTQKFYQSVVLKYIDPTDNATQTHKRLKKALAGVSIGTLILTRKEAIDFAGYICKTYGADTSKVQNYSDEEDGLPTPQMREEYEPSPQSSPATITFNLLEQQNSVNLVTEHEHSENQTQDTDASDRVEDQDYISDADSLAGEFEELDKLDEENAKRKQLLENEENLNKELKKEKALLRTEVRNLIEIRKRENEGLGEKHNSMKLDNQKIASKIQHYKNKYNDLKQKESVVPNIRNDNSSQINAQTTDQTSTFNFSS